MLSQIAALPLTSFGLRSATNFTARELQAVGRQWPKLTSESISSVHTVFRWSPCRLVCVDLELDCVGNYKLLQTDFVHLAPLTDLRSLKLLQCTDFDRTAGDPMPTYATCWSSEAR